ncbi:hypothetical protein MSM1_14045 [Mycobacterium sp. SM1]|uniref:hypothetical protein n=1 Tax=Mycobacterium sp. SM1 TaxID=2816243 RepID=UPI001BCAB6D9|nr:hypothetical protein [Mycobacterium sp. SM1]MBS4729413.1 hypothetical protein [Mycobacterium sp. SM1]
MSRRAPRTGRSDLGLLADPQPVGALTEDLRAGAIAHKKAKDILRAARLRLLPVGNPHLASRFADLPAGRLWAVVGAEPAQAARRFDPA